MNSAIPTIFCVLLLGSACSPSGNDESEPEESSTEVLTDEARPSGNDNGVGGGLESSGTTIFGLPLPEGLHLVEQDSDIARFETVNTVDALSRFYSASLEGYHLTSRSDGLKFEDQDGNGPTVYLIEGDESRQVTYLRGGVDRELAELFDRTTRSEDGTRAAPHSGHRWPSGPTIVRNPDTPQPPPPPTTTDNQIYEESFREVEGRRVRVLTRRPQPTDNHEVVEPIDPSDLPIGRVRGGAYHRGNGVYSMSSPRLDENGDPLPFLGSTRVELPPGTIH